MAMRWSFVGALGAGKKLDWGGPIGGNIPVGGTLPDIDDTVVYQMIANLASRGEYQGKVIDFDAYGVKVNGPELRHIISECFRDSPGNLDRADIQQYLDYADALGIKKYVAFVAVAM